MPDFSPPIGLPVLGVSYFVLPEVDHPVVAHDHRDAAASGGFRVLSHFVVDIKEGEVTGVSQVLRRGGAPAYPRSRTEITEPLRGSEPAEPDVVETVLWCPEDPESSVDRPGASPGTGHEPCGRYRFGVFEENECRSCLCGNRLCRGGRGRARQRRC